MKTHTPGRIDWPALLKAARRVRANAYAPYSKYKVGAAVLGGSGRIYAGCNVENSSFGLTICAERSAIVQAISGGEQEIVACAIAVGPRPAPSCGMCRQVFAEFADPSMPLVLSAGRTRELHTLGELLPHAFGSHHF